MSVDQEGQYYVYQNVAALDTAATRSSSFYVMQNIISALQTPNTGGEHYVYQNVQTVSPAKRYVWDGVQWVRTPEYVWSGSAWQQIV